MMKTGRGMGFESTVVIVFDSISSVIAPEAEKIAMNKPDKKSVERPISRRSFMSSSRVYIVIEGLRMNKSRAEMTMTA